MMSRDARCLCCYGNLAQQMVLLMTNSTARSWRTFIHPAW